APPRRYTLSLHDALLIFPSRRAAAVGHQCGSSGLRVNDRLVIESPAAPPALSIQGAPAYRMRYAWHALACPAILPSLACLRMVQNRLLRKLRNDLSALSARRSRTIDQFPLG